MNPEAQEELNRILKIEPKELNADEIGFLRARRSYLKQSQLDEYASVLKIENQTSEEETVKPKDAKRK